MSALFRWFVVLAGAYEALFGAVLIASVAAPGGGRGAAAISNFTLGGLLMFVAAVLIWASLQLRTRGCLVLWNALFRFWIAGAMGFEIARGYVVGRTAATTGALATIDAIVAVLFVSGLVLVLRASLVDLFLGRAAVERFRLR